LNPTHDPANDRSLIGVCILYIIVFNVAFDEVDGLILPVLILLLPDGLVVAHEVPQVGRRGDHFLRQLPLELVRTRLTHGLSVDLQDVEEGLPDSRVLDHSAVVKGADGLLEELIVLEEKSLKLQFHALSIKIFLFIIHRRIRMIVDRCS
jgi:hypothetical protein